MKDLELQWPQKKTGIACPQCSTIMEQQPVRGKGDIYVEIKCPRCKREHA